ncbi:hypothetical protein U8527_13595 [Kordia algicida OT-1]|uniref:Uncharacterized protein n=1 Tax=Kordia algicida OT-1 TaxID=391587 RepID=A9DWU3_9FLAO|nr:hypothetical protein [Kordia algicida]EDP95931.1 hypothetical protein KAOT1_07178 [Kordia algicida OT-1]
MKKRDLKSLKLNKKSVSNLDANATKGGAAGTNSWVGLCGKSWDQSCKWTEFLCDWF